MNASIKIKAIPYRIIADIIFHQLLSQFLDEGHTARLIIVFLCSKKLLLRMPFGMMPFLVQLNEFHNEKKAKSVG